MCRDLGGAGAHPQDGAQPPAYPGGLHRQSTLVVVLLLQLMGKGAEAAVTVPDPSRCPSPLSSQAQCRCFSPSHSWGTAGSSPPAQRQNLAV